MKSENCCAASNRGDIVLDPVGGNLNAAVSLPYFEYYGLLKDATTLEHVLCLVKNLEPAEAVAAIFAMMVWNEDDE